MNDPNRPPARPGPPNLVERLYVLWIVSSVTLLVVFIVLNQVAAGRISRLGERLDRLESRIEAGPPPAPHTPSGVAVPRGASGDRRPPDPRPSPLSVHRMDESSESKEPQASAPESEAEVGSATAAARREAEPPAQREPRPARESAPPAEEPPRRAGAPGGLDETALARRLDGALRDAVDVPYAINDPAAAARLLEDVLAAAEVDAWSAESWARLAALARLLDAGDVAEAFARRAADLGRAPVEYLTIASRLALATGRTDEARALALRMLEQTRGDARARLLLAECLAAPPRASLADAAAQLDAVGDPAELGPVDRVRLGRLLMDLEAWPRLAGLVKTLEDAPAALAAERDLLRAAVSIHQGRLVEGLAILDYLLDQRPDDYDVRTWRGVALLQARSYEAAREALAHAEQYATRPQAWYWRAVLELRTGNPDSASNLLEAALVASPSFAPAWEALAKIALDRRDVNAAIQNLGEAIRSNPRRASAYFMRAIAAGKLGRADDAAADLRAAFALDRGLVETAKTVEVLSQLFDAQEIDAFADEAAAPTDVPASAR